MTPHIVLMSRENLLLYQAVNLFMFAIKLGIFKWALMGIDPLLEPSLMWSFEKLQLLAILCGLYFCQPWRLPLG